ncbi:hypothetical protein BG011_003908 [Mortierella polycephala]|uniref:Protein kinase domain-containing protein n=1 Tax=Mortierella polycephala TaxID=41804 RepID=A0A9P6Q2G1_9FUNG|nr:hypothetical protein BG011_003908 [Mortierella polycephala]
MERISSTGSIKRPSSINSGSGYISTSPVSSMAPVAVGLHDDSFSNNPEDYDIRLPIGYGSSAVVYNAYYKPLNKRVAIKVIDLDMFERNQIDELRRETQVMALCKHPNVLRVNGAFVADSKLYIVTPYLSAGSCLDIMKTAYPDGFDEVSIATILKQALQGLDYLHKNGHIHRDVKAGNLLMDEDGSVLLADFGVSSSLMETGDRRGMRKTFVGTPCWMAPEVMEQAGYDYKADIWSFGITAIELATGHAPFAKYPPIKVLMLTLSNDPPTLDRESTKHRYSKLLKEMIDSCLQKDPARRPSAEKLLNHSFFRQAKKKSYLVSGLLHNLPPLEQRPQKKATQKTTLPQKGVSWDFDGDDDDTPTDPKPTEAESARRPRTVTFEPSERPVSSATTESISSAGVVGTPVMESRPLDTMLEDGLSPHSGTPLSSQASDKPVKKSRFVIEEAAYPAVSSPTLSYTADPSSSPIGATSPSPSYNAASTAPIQSSQNLHGLGVSSSGADQTGVTEVRKGRFSVKDTTLSITSPSPASIKAMGNDSLLSPSRSLSPSPIEYGADGVNIGGSLDLGSSSAAEMGGSSHSTPNTSPSGSLSRGQAPMIDVQGVHSVYSHLDILYRQNEQQRAILTELFAGLGLKAGSGHAVFPTAITSKSQAGILENVPSSSSVASTSANSSGSIHRHEAGLGQTNLERQLQLTTRENESLRRENEALKRELDRLRRGL